MQLAEAKKNFSQFVQQLQNSITDEMKRLDPTLKITQDIWQRTDFQGAPGGGGITRFHQGKIYEAAGVNTSEVFGAVDPKFAASLHGDGAQLWASGISLIIHPLSPKIPTVHANFRMIHQGHRYWFGGGADLTPFYPFEEDFAYFHEVWQKACAPYECYQKMRAECDQYFTNHHRGNEMRGVSGIFFDHYHTDHLAHDYDMVLDLAGHFIKSYFPIVEKRIHETWTAEDEEFQLFRRGRYVEFNLLHDRGTLFGLKTNGRTESILISLPPRCRFQYQYHPRPGSVQEKMMSYYLRPS